MTKLHTLLLAAAIASSVAAPAMATQQSPQPLAMSTSLMAIGNPHSAADAPAAADAADVAARIEEQRRVDMADWQALLGNQQPSPAMGVGGHSR